jgi:hypothetical protein
MQWQGHAQDARWQAGPVPVSESARKNQSHNVQDVILGYDLELGLDATPWQSRTAVGAVYLAGRCCGSDVQLAWICAVSTFLQQPSLTLSALQSLSFPSCHTPALHRPIMTEKLADFSAQIHI